MSDEIKINEEPAVISPLAVVYSILVFVAAIPLLSILYALVIYYNPIIHWVNPLLTVIFAAFVSLLVEHRVIGSLGFTNAFLLFLVCIVGGLLALVCSWLAWLAIVSEGGGFPSFPVMFEMVRDPSLTLDYIARINEKGIWGASLGSGNKSDGMVSGIALTIIWIIESLIIIGFPLLIAIDKVFKIKKEKSADT